MKRNNHRFARQVKNKRNLAASELIEVFGEWVQLPEPVGVFRNRLFNVHQTFWLFLSQVLSADKSCGRDSQEVACPASFIKRGNCITEYCGILQSQIAITGTSFERNKYPCCG